MNEMNAWEKQLRSWTLRRPSAKVTAQLFERAEKAPELLRRPELWNWLTPLAACCLAMLVALGSSRYHAARFPDTADADLVAAVMASGASSNLQPTLPIGQLDQNVQCNNWDRIAAIHLTNLSESSEGFRKWRASATNR